MADERRPSEPSEAGSALLLLPAGFLILLLLAALSFDLSLSFQRKRELVELADAAANDAVTFGLDETRLRADGAYCLSRARVSAAVAANVAVSELDVQVLEVSIRTAPGSPCPNAVTVTLRTAAPQPFGHAVPGAADRVILTATGQATAVVR